MANDIISPENLVYKKPTFDERYDNALLSRLFTWCGS